MIYTALLHWQTSLVCQKIRYWIISILPKYSIKQFQNKSAELLFNGFLIQLNVFIKLTVIMIVPATWSACLIEYKNENHGKYSAKAISDKSCLLPSMSMTRFKLGNFVFMCMLFCYSVWGLIDSKGCLRAETLSDAGVWCNLTRTDCRKHDLIVTCTVHFMPGNENCIWQKFVLIIII